MTEAPKRIWAWSWKGQEGEAGQWVNYGVGDDPEYILATDLAASPEGQALIAAARVVKPLVWEFGLGTCQRAYGLGFCYEVARAETGEWHWWRQYVQHLMSEAYPTIEAAKAAAQADYEARILAALEPAPDALAALERIKAEAREEGRKAGLLEAAGMITLGDTVTRTQARILAATETPA